MSTLRYAVRSLLKSPGFFAVAVATMALGIAVNTAIFSVLNGVLLRPLPFPDEHRVVQLFLATKNAPDGNFSAGAFMDIRERNRTLQAIAGFRQNLVGVAAAPVEPRLLQAAWVTPGFFDVFATPPLAGRPFAEADKPAGRKLVVLGQDAAQQMFGDANAAINRAVNIDGDAYTVSAVMPEAFAWPQRTKIWLLSDLPVPPAPVVLRDPLINREVQYFEAIARIRADVTFAQAQQDLHAVAATIRPEHGQRGDGADVRPVPIRETLVGGVRDALLIIQAAVGLVLLIACANVSSLLIARAAGRRRELAVRAALGASRGRLVRQLLAESLVLGACGGGAGLLLSSWLIQLLTRVLPGGVPRVNAIALDSTVMLVTILLSIATGVLFGILPALQGSRIAAGSAMKEGGERSSGRSRGRAALVVAEIALTLVLLAAAGLLASSLLQLQRVDPGFDPDGAVIAHLMVPQSRYPTGADQTRLYRQLLERLGQRTEVQAAGVGFPGPFRGGSASATVEIEGRAPASGADRPFVHLAAASGGYFGAMRIPLLTGRRFDDRDGATAPRVAIVSASLARRYFPGQDAIGKRLRFDESGNSPWLTIVGIVGDVRQLGLRREPPPVLYLPFEQFPLPFTTVIVRSSMSQDALAPLVRSQLAAIDPQLPFGDIRPLQASVDSNFDQPRFRALLIGTFALLALVLAAVGVYGLISYTVTGRTREIGIRVALGAAPRQVILPVIREGVVLALAGIGIGLAAAVAATRLLSAFLFGVGATDPLTFAGGAVLMLLVSLVASYIPSRRALRVDPVRALRAE